MFNKVALYTLLISLQAVPGLGHALLVSIKVGATEYPGWSDNAGVCKLLFYLAILKIISSNRQTN